VAEATPTPPTSYKEWQLAGQPGTYEDWLGKKDSVGLTFSSNDIERIMTTGLSESDINLIQKDINEFGWDAVKERLSSEQATAIENVLSGVTPTQVRKEQEGEIYLSESQMKDVAIELVKSYGNTDDAIKAVEQGVLMINDKEINLTAEQVTRLKEVINEQYPEGRTTWQKILPWGK